MSPSRRVQTNDPAASTSTLTSLSPRDARITPRSGLNGPERNKLGKPDIQENVFLFWPNIIGYARVLLAFASLYYMPRHPRACSALYSISCLLDAVDGYAARYFKQRTRFGTALDMVTDRCTTTCLLVFLATAWERYALVFKALISLDLASHYFQMYATLTMGGSDSHKDVDVSRSWLLNLYYTNKVVLFLCCFCNEAFFIALYLISFSPPPQIAIFQGESLDTAVWLYGLLQLAGSNPLLILAIVCFPVMFIKQFINILQLVKASRWLAEGDVEIRKRERESSTGRNREGKRSLPYMSLRRVSG